MLNITTRISENKFFMTDIIENIFTYIDGQPLLFTQLYFWLFLFVVLCVFAVLKNKLKLAHLWLLLVSYFFYYKSSGNFVVLLLLTTVLTYLFAKGVEKTQRRPIKKLLLIVGIILDSAFLLYFKYTYFFIDLLNTYCHTDIVAKDYLALFVNNSFGTSFSIDKIILPVGISFYTFQAISFIVDTYKQRFENKTDFLDFAFYLTFFPQLVAGPIVRADVFLPQIKNEWSLNKRDFSFAVFFILKGLVKKIFVADYISLNFVDRVFATPEVFTPMENLLATFGYTMQIYCDFSGYTDIAIAISLLFGFHLPLNFNSPYKAKTITEFWRRWHISLSTWLRDYIYIPLGGNRKGKARQYLNLMITMLVGGFWHGANIKFIFWGGMHGLLLSLDKIIKPITDWLKKYRVGNVLLIFLTFNIVNVLWIFFRADSFDIALTIINRSLSADFSTIIPIFIAYWKPLVIIAFTLIIHLVPENIKLHWRDGFVKVPIWVKILIIVVVVFVLVQVKSSAIQPFIYFQF